MRMERQIIPRGKWQVRKIVIPVLWDASFPAIDDEELK